MSYSTHLPKNLSISEPTKNFFRLPNSELHSKTVQAASHEKLATLELLEYLTEVDRRRLYAEKAYSSLWEYVHKALGYSEAQASERVSAMRLMKRVPEVKAALKTGELTLTSTAKLASHVRREKIDSEQTLRLLEKCQGKSSREIEKVLVENSTQATPLPERVRAVTPEITRLTLEVDESFMKLIQRMKELKGNTGLEVREVFASAMQEFIKKREPKLKDIPNVKDASNVASKETQTSTLRAETACDSASSAATPAENLEMNNPTIAPQHAALRAPEVKRSRYIPVQIRHQIRHRAHDQCEYIDPENEKRCACRTGLELDHIQPFAENGANVAENLRLVCKTHNLLYATKAYGTEKMSAYLRE